MKTALRPWEWGIAGAPVVCALFIYGLTSGPWLVALPLIALVVFAMARGIRVERQPWKLVVTAVVGTLLGFVLFLQESGPPTAIPPIVLIPLSAALACLSCYVLLSRQPMYSWLYGWLLAVLCLHVPPQGPALLALLALVISTLLCCLVLGGTIRTGWTGAVGFLVFIVCVSAIGFQLVRLALGSEEALLNNLSRWISELEPPGGVGLQSEIIIGSRTMVSPSNRALLELDGPPPEHLRTHIMEKFDGAKWAAAELTGGRAVRVTGGDDAPVKRDQHMLMIERLEGVIPAPAGTMSIEGASARPERGWVWRTLETPRREVTLHRTESELLPKETAPDAVTTQLPESMQIEFQQLAQEIVQGAATPRQRAERIERFFQTQFLYSLDSDLRGNGHPLSVLIRERRPAYCIYFASAMAVLLRSLNVPARIVGGFAPNEVNPFTRRTIVRVRDAHAWVEAYLPEEGRWVAFDPTPAQSRDAVLDQRRTKWFAMLWDALASTARRQWMAFKDDPVGYMIGMLTSPIGLLVIAGIVVWQVRKRWRGIAFRRRAVALESTDPDLRAAYRRYKAILRRIQIEPALDETDDDVIARVRETAGANGADAAERFVVAYRSARYAAGDKQRLDESLMTLEQTLRRTG